MWAKFHPHRTNFRVKRLVRKKVVTPKRSNSTRCSTNSASNDKNSSQCELKKMKLCMWLVNYFHYVCAKVHPNRTTFSVRRLAWKKVVKPQSTYFTGCSINSASNQNFLSQGERWKLTLYMQSSQLPPLCVCQISSKSNKSQGKKSGEEKSGQNKKIKLHEVLDDLCFQSQNLQSNGA